MIEYSEEVEKAIKQNLPIVALESTIISFGMPYPQNLHMANKVEDIVRSQGAIPATIGFVNGKIKIGLKQEELETFASSKQIIKTSIRDIPYILALKKWGATTVASTIFAAQKANIAVCVTGGIGGVHRDVIHSMDISADLAALARYNVAVVCSGVKSILDVAKTLEILESLGVPIIGYCSDKLPLFFSHDSDYNVDYRIDSIPDIANIMRTKWNAQLEGSILIANPVPKEKEIPKEKIEDILQSLCKKAVEKQITGKDITPFLLQEVVKESKGKSLDANIALIENNALLGAKIAREFYL